MGNGLKKLSVFYFLMNFKIADFGLKAPKILLACF